MKIIRDNQLNGLLMIPLYNQYGITRCNVRDCKEKQTTIVTELTERPFGLCESHYEEFSTKGEIKCTLNF